MPTIKARINISVSSGMKQSLHKLARRDQMPTATKAERLLELALELEEDKVWDSLAKARDTKARYVYHGKAWK
jgi:hypothetical protein